MIGIGVAIIELLHGLLAATAPSPLSLERPVDEYLPNPDKLAASMPDAASREAMINAYLARVQPRYDQAVADGLVARLEQAQPLHLAMKSGAAGVTKPVAGLANNTVDFFYEKLVLDNRSAAGGTVVGRDLVTGATNPADHISSSEIAVRAIMSLRHVDDLLTRVLAAQQAATALGVPLREIMAMYRTEGDLNAPPSADSLGLDTTPPLTLLEIPPGVTDAETSIKPKPEITQLVVVRRNDPAISVADWQLYGARVWFVQIAGLDVVGSLDLRNIRDDFQKFSSGNRAAASLPDSTMADAGHRFDKAVANMIVTKRTSRGKEAVIIAPKEPIALVSVVLQEAIALRRKLALFKKDVSTDPEADFDLSLDDSLSYLRYHQTETFKAYLVRAALAANEVTGLQFSELRRELLDDVRLQSTLVVMARVKGIKDSAASVLVLNAGWPALVNWFSVLPVFSTTNRFDLLADFLKTADSSVWPKWTEGRGNMSRYAVLLDYYRRLFP